MFKKFSFSGTGNLILKPVLVCALSLRMYGCECHAWVCVQSSVGAIIKLEKARFSLFSHCSDATFLQCCMKAEHCYSQCQCLCWPWTCCSKHQMLVRSSEFLFSFRNARLSIPALSSPGWGNKAGLLLFGHLSHPLVNSCGGHWGFYACVYV